MNYQLRSENPLSGYLQIEASFRVEGATDVEIQLPAWRPGRYEIQNFAKNIREMAAKDEEGRSLPLTKIRKDRWRVSCNSSGIVKVIYSYFGRQMDAGGTWIDDSRWYINFVNCLLYILGREYEPCQVELQLPDDYEVAGSLEKKGPRTWTAASYYELVDSPIIASANLIHWEFTHHETPFHLWFSAEPHLEKEKVIGHFKGFITKQLEMMGALPFRQYHFLFLLTPHSFYHGVEHANSTVIALGPPERLKTEDFYREFVGVSSHELFHAWNIIRLRPVELTPYDFSQEVYFPTGFVAEGFTTYLGDLFLARAGIFDKSWFFDEMTKNLKRHAEKAANTLSLAESSYDLWLDGYNAGVPGRKVSIYVKGCLVALMMDLKIRSYSEHAAGMDQLMRKLWQLYGENSRGYSMEDIRACAEQVSGNSFHSFFDRYITGTDAVFPELNTLLGEVGCKLVKEHADSNQEHKFGFKTNENGEVTGIAEDSPACEHLMLQDEILAIDGMKRNAYWDGMLNKNEVRCTIIRQGRLHDVHLAANDRIFFSAFRMQPDPKANELARKRFTNWLHQIP